MTPRAPGRAQDDLQDVSRDPKMPQDGSHDPPRGPKTAPRRLQVAKELPHWRPPKSFQNLRENTVVGFSPVRYRWPSQASRWLQ
eukprot:6090649-Pyramimonas_sp.AAC.1